MLRLFAYLMTDTLELYEDFTAAVTWPTSGHWTYTTVGTATNSYSNGRGYLRVGTVTSALSVVPIVSDAESYDIKFRFYSETGITGRLNLIVGWGDSPTVTGGNFNIDNGVYIAGDPAGTSSTITAKKNGSAAAGPALSAFTIGQSGTTMSWYRMRKEGTVFSLKRWADTGTEPTAWQYTWDMGSSAPDLASMATKKPFIVIEGNYTSSVGVQFDDFTASSIASTVINGGYTAQPMTATGLITDAAFPNKTVTAAVMTATGTAVNPVITAVGPLHIATNFDDKVNPFATGSTSTGDFAISTVGSLSDNFARLNNFAFYQGGEVLYHVLSVTGSNVFAGGKFNTATSSSVVAVARINNGSWVRLQHNGTNIKYRVWSDTASEPATWSTGGVAVAGAPFDLDIQPSSNGTAIIDYLAASETTSVVMPNALVIAGAMSGTAVMTDAVVTLARNVNVATTVATATGLAVDPTVSNATPVQVIATAATGTSLFADASVSVIKHASINAPVLEGYAEGPLGGFSVPLTFVATAATASGTALDASLSAELNSVVRAEAANSMAVLMAPVEAQNNLDDPYYNRLFSTTGAGDYWYRLDEVAGAVVADTRDPNKNADLFGSYSFGVYGPEGRRSMHFTSGYFTPRVGTTTDFMGGRDDETAEMRFETVIRTSNGNGVLAYGLDNKPQQAVFRNAVYLKGGKVSIEWNRLDGGTPFSLTGFKNIADGQWHHVVVTMGTGNAKELDSGLRIYIDGKLDVRRRMEAAPEIWATPDSYFGMPDSWRNVTPLFPWQGNFEGDVMEAVFSKDDIVADIAQALYYDAFGIKPIYAGVATGWAEAPNAKAKGNRKRALVLYTKWNGAGNFNSTLAGDERNAPSSWNASIPDEFDHDITIGRVYEPGANPWEEVAGYRIVPVSIMREDSILNGGPYRDPVTDLPRLLNLQEDLNLDDYSLIIFRNWPDEGADLEVFRSRGYGNQAIEDFLGSVKQAVIEGISLEVTNPNLASRLGLISGAQPIPMMVDRNSDKKKPGESDIRAAVVNPWDKDRDGNTYLDLHANNWHRVVAQIENLTDIPETEHITEATLTYNDGVDGNINNQWNYKLEAGPLRIGEEFIDSTLFFNRIQAYGSIGAPTERVWDRYLWAITPNGLSVGTPVYKFANKMWQGNTQVDNPYRDFIGAAIVQPGDVWDGKQIAGKVFINLAESPFTALKGPEVMYRQVVPPNSEIINPLEWEDAEKRAWDYSMTRLSFTAVAIGDVTGSSKNNQLTTYVDEQGRVHIGTVSTNTAAGLVGINISEKYPTEPVVTPSWALRGLAWLGVNEEVESGSVVIRTTAAAATGSMPDAKVTAQKSVVINTQTAISNGRMVSPTEVDEPDVTVYAFPATASGIMTTYGKTIHVAPFEATGELVDNFDLISAAGEQVVVYLHYTDAEVYLKEEIK